MRNFQIIGEAARNIPEEIKEQYRDIPWSRMIGLRNIVVHAYFGVDLEIIWNISIKNIPETKPGIIIVLKEYKERMEKEEKNKS